MDVRSLENVLALLRQLRSSNMQEPTIKLVSKWVGTDDAAICMALSQIQEQIQLARAAVTNSQLDGDAAQGVHNILNFMAGVFSIQSLNSPAAVHANMIPQGISILSMLVSASGGVSGERNSPKEARELVAEIENVFQMFEDKDIDPVVRDTAKRHLQILSTFLQHVPVFGLDAALVAYFDLMLKVRRADIGASDASTKKTTSIWDKMNVWGGRLKMLDGIWNEGAKLASSVHEHNLLHYIPNH